MCYKYDNNNVLFIEIDGSNKESQPKWNAGIEKRVTTYAVCRNRRC